MKRGFTGGNPGRCLTDHRGGKEKQFNFDFRMRKHKAFYMFAFKMESTEHKNDLTNTKRN